MNSPSDLDRIAAENTLLRAALRQAQSTVWFLHGCLTCPGTHRYAHPEHTAARLREWAELAPRPESCPHSGYQPTCPACVVHRELRRQVHAARQILAADAEGIVTHPETADE